MRQKCPAETLAFKGVTEAFQSPHHGCPAGAGRGNGEGERGWGFFLHKKQRHRVGQGQARVCLPGTTCAASGFSPGPGPGCWDATLALAGLFEGSLCSFHVEAPRRWQPKAPRPWAWGLASPTPSKGLSFPGEPAWRLPPPGLPGPGPVFSPGEPAVSFLGG